MSKPDPSITADLLSSLPVKKADAHTDASAQPDKKGHAGPRAPQAKLSSRSAEKSTVPGRTRTSNRGK
jgi:hypothetical protein